MDVTSHGSSSDITENGANKNSPQSECTLTQPAANGMLSRYHTEEAPPLIFDRSEDGDSSKDLLTDSCSTNDIAQFRPAQSHSGIQKQKGVDGSPVSAAPICIPPSSSSITPSLPSRRSTCNILDSSLPPPHHRHCQNQHGTNQRCLSSNKSNSYLKTDAAHIKEVAGNDCCVHCLLACLFCEVLSMCSALGECLACGVGGAGCCEAAGSCCCCLEAAGEAACTEEACQAVLDCGIVEDCCGSSDCLEICLECCSICFPT